MINNALGALGAMAAFYPLVARDDGVRLLVVEPGWVRSYRHGEKNLKAALTTVLGPVLPDLTFIDRPLFAVHLEEVPVLTGGLDLAEYVRLARSQDHGLPMMLEPDEADYAAALGRLTTAGLMG